MNFDQSISEKRWEMLYKTGKIGVKADYKTDQTIISYRKFLTKYSKKIKSGIFLDLGCGVAFISAILAKEGIKVIGVDVSKSAINKSKALFKKEGLVGEFLQSDLLSLPIKDEYVSFIYSCMSLEYVGNTSLALNEAFRVLKHKGTMVTIVPSVSLTTLTYHQLRGSIPGIPIVKNIAELFHFGFLKGKYMQYGYERSFTGRELKKIFSQAGFKVKKVGRADIYYPVEFIPSYFQPVFRKLLRNRIFSPLIYIEAYKS